MKKGREQLALGLAGDKRTPTGPERTLEVNCSNCGAKFVAFYGYDEENVETVEVRSRGLCRGAERAPSGTRTYAGGFWWKSI